MRTRFKTTNKNVIPARKMHIKIGDNIVVLSGKYKGKKGKILTLDKSRRMAIVEGINVVTKHQKAKNEGEISGFIKKETFINASKVQLVCPHCLKTTRISKKIVDENKHMRCCKKCNEIIE